jgi:hypothetical protein
MDQPICVLDSSNDVVLAKDVPFEGGVDTKFHLGVENSPKPLVFTTNAKLPAK